MAEKNYFHGIKSTVRISSDISTKCKECEVFLDSDDVTETINHYIAEHKYKLLHIGEETSHSDHGLWHRTVALVGK